jgi:hypothetical protein
MQSRTKVLATALLAVVMITAVSIPALAAPASQTFQVLTDKKIDQPGAPVLIIAFVKQDSPSCDYSVQLTVTAPDGTTSNAVVQLSTRGGGNGHAFALFPNGFSSGASTSTPGTYNVSATFTCGYSGGAASTSFVVVNPHGHDSGLDRIEFSFGHFGR